MDFDPDSPVAAFVAASQAHDVTGLVACTTSDVVLRSPITTSFTFRGQAQLHRLMTDVFEVLPDARYTGDVGDSRTRAIRGTATIDGMELNEIVLVELDRSGLVESIELFMRPMPAVAALAAKLGPRVAARRSRSRAIAARAMFAPLALALRRGESLGVRLARPE